MTLQLSKPQRELPCASLSRQGEADRWPPWGGRVRWILLELAWGGAVQEGCHLVLLVQLQPLLPEKQRVPAPANAGVWLGSRLRVRHWAGRGAPRVWQQSGHVPETALPAVGALHWWRAGGGKAPVQQLVLLRHSPALPVRTNAYPARSAAREPRCGGRMDQQARSSGRGTGRGTANCLCQSAFQPNRRSTHLLTCVAAIVTGRRGHSSAVNTGTAIEGRPALPPRTPQPPCCLPSPCHCPPPPAFPRLLPPPPTPRAGARGTESGRTRHAPCSCAAGCHPWPRGTRRGAPLL